MIGIVPELFRQRECRRHDAVQKDRVGAEEVEKRRQLLLDLGADRLERSLVAQELGDAGQPCIEELAMVALADQEIDEVGRERREIYPARLPSYEIQRKGTGAGMLERSRELRQQTQDRLRQPGAVAWHLKPAAHDIDEIDAFQFCRDDVSAEKMHLNELA